MKGIILIHKPLGINPFKNSWKFKPKIGYTIDREIKQIKNNIGKNKFQTFLPKKNIKEKIRPSQAPLDEVKTIDRGVNRRKKSLKSCGIIFFEKANVVAKQKAKLYLTKNHSNLDY